jgi:hypothetical protein
MAAGLVHPATAQDTPTLAGKWSLNRELSQFPKEVGFNADWMSGATAGADTTTGGAAGGASGGGGRTNFPVSRESREDATRRRMLTDEVREPSASLTITETATDVTIATANGTSRTFHPTGKPEVLQEGDIPLTVTATREGGRLVVLYRVVQGRELRYTYSRIASPSQLVVEVQFLERGKGDTVKRVYDAVAPVAPAAPAAPVSPAGSFDQRPDAQLRGLTKLGVVVEGLSAQATTCGLQQEALEQAVTKPLSAAGLTVARNTDEDTYVYVNVMTATMANGLCISRYDAYLYTHTTASLQYHATPVLVDVSLARKGSLAAGAAAAHADAVMKGVQEYVGQFATRIRDANK